MTAKTAKTRNPDRRSGKAWGKHRNPTVAEVQREQDRRARRAVKRAAREAKMVVHSTKGPSITIPKITWGWFGEVMQGRHNHTRRLRMFDAGASQERSRP